MLDDLRGLDRESVLLADAWDDLAGGNSESPRGLDPTLTQAIRDFHALVDGERSEGPDPAFVRKLLDDLTSSASRMQPPPFAIVHRSFSSANGPADRSLPRPPVGLPTPRRRQFARPLATAALLLLTLTAGLAAVGALRSGTHDRQRIAPAVSSIPMLGPVEFVAEITSAPEHVLFEPSFVNIDPEGNVWITDDRYDRFLIFGPDGTFLEAWGVAGNGDGELNFNAQGHGYGNGDIAWDADGNFYVADTGNSRVQKFDPERRFVLSWGGEGREDGQFEQPIGIAVSSDDRVYVTDANRDDIQIFDRSGAFLGKFGGFGVGEGQFLSVLGGIAVSATGDLLVADYEGDRLQRFDRDGNFLGTWGGFGGGDGRFARPENIATDMMGRVYVTDSFNHRVQVLDPDGRFLSAWGREGSDIGQFVYPAGIALDGFGNIYIVDSGNDRIQKFRLLPPVWPGSVLATELPPSSTDGPP